MDSSRMRTARCSCRLGGGGGSAKGVCQPGGVHPPGPRGRHPLLDPEADTLHPREQTVATQTVVKTLPFRYYCCGR